jgi:DNA-binding XRE family transcriptional regulator
MDKFIYDKTEFISARHKLLLTRAELARKASVSESTIMRLERGLNLLLTTLKRIAETLGFKPTIKFQD